MTDDDGCVRETAPTCNLGVSLACWPVGNGFLDP